MNGRRATRGSLVPLGLISDLFSLLRGIEAESREQRAEREQHGLLFAIFIAIFVDGFGLTRSQIFESFIFFLKLNYGKQFRDQV